MAREGARGRGNTRGREDSGLQGAREERGCGWRGARERRGRVRTRGSRGRERERAWRCARGRVREGARRSAEGAHARARAASALVHGGARGRALGRARAEAREVGGRVHRARGCTGKARERAHRGHFRGIGAESSLCGISRRTTSRVSRRPTAVREVAFRPPVPAPAGRRFSRSAGARERPTGTAHGISHVAALARPSTARLAA